MFLIYNALKLSLYQIFLYWYLTSLWVNFTDLVNTGKKLGGHSPLQGGVGDWQLLYAGSLINETIGDTSFRSLNWPRRGLKSPSLYLFPPTPTLVKYSLSNIKLLSPPGKVNSSMVPAQHKQRLLTKSSVLDPYIVRIWCKLFLWTYMLGLK